jgi:hypothetical protein
VWAERIAGVSFPADYSQPTVGLVTKEAIAARKRASTPAGARKYLKNKK